jgi:formaldehyde-activating enzyme involved in methanogenesis
MINRSGLHPQGHAILLAPYEPEVKIWSDTLIIPDAVRESLQVLENRQVVIEVGADAWKDETVPRAQPGDVVMITKHAGFVATGADGKLYRFVNGREVFCRIDVKAFDAAKAAKEKAA